MADDKLKDSELNGSELKDKEAKGDDTGEKPKPGEPGYLYAGKYKTVEEMEAGIKEAERKISELGEKKAAADKALMEHISLINKLKAADAEKLEKKKAEERKAKVARFRAAFEKDPESALETIEMLVDDKINQAGVMKHSDYDAKLKQERAAVTTFNKVRSAHKEDFDALRPEMAKLWARLPEKARVPEMLETIYLAAKATASPSLKEKIISDLKATHTVAPGGVSPEDKRTEEEKMTDDIIKAHEVTRKIL